MMLTHILVLVVGISRANICSKNVLFTSETVELYNKEEERYTTETQVKFSIGLRETVCFEVLDEKDFGRLKPVVYSLTFSEVQKIFNYKNSYEFAIATPNVTCVCDCPGLEDHCSPRRDSCEEDGKTDRNCWNFYKGDESAEGCGIFAPLGAAEICCSIQFDPYTKQKYRAFEIARPTVRGRLSLETANQGKITNRGFLADLEKGSKIFMDHVTLSFETPGQLEPVPHGWYFGRSDTSEVLTNVKINGLNEWDVHKLGWLKHDGELQFHHAEVKPAFSAETLNCKENQVSAHFASDYSNRDLVEAKTMEDYYSSLIESAERDDTERHVVVSFRQYDKLNAMLKFPSTWTVVQHFSSAFFVDFRATALFDKHSNRVLNVTIVRGVGTIHGTMKIGKETVESFDFTIRSEEDESGDVVLVDYNNYVRITQWCDDSAGDAKLCLHTGDRNAEICKPISCESEENIDFEIPRTAVSHKSGHREMISDMAVWKKYLNPAQWFNGLTGMQEAVVMFTVLLSSTLLLVGAVLVFKKTTLKYHLADVWARLPWLSKSYKEELRFYSETGFEESMTRRRSRRMPCWRSCSSSSVTDSCGTSDGSPPLKRLCCYDCEKRVCV